MQITRIKPGGWLIILLVIAALIFGIRSCGRFLSGRPAALAGGGGTGGGDTASGGTGALSASQAGGDILVSTTRTKQKWIQDEIEKFNRQSQVGKVTLDLTESRESMQAILNGKLKPAVWSPSSPAWTERLAEVWPKTHGGAQIADPNNSQTYRVLFKSPLVFLTTKQKAGPNPWAAVRQLSLGQRKTPWGAFHFAYADPLNASSGMLTMSLIVTEYTKTHGGVDNPTAAVSGPQFAAYLRQLDRGYVHDAATAGSSALEKAFTADPRSRDFITAYENAALAAVESNPNLVMIYPSPTANADQGAALLSASWINDSQKATAAAFLDFLSKPEALADGVQYYFRPAQNGGPTLAARLSPATRPVPVQLHFD